MKKVYVVEANFSDGDSFVGGIYTSLEKGIEAIEKWADCPEVIEVKRKEVEEKDFAILEVFFEEDNEKVVFTVEDYFLNVDMPECF